MTAKVSVVFHAPPQILNGKAPPACKAAPASCLRSVLYADGSETAPHGGQKGPWEPTCGCAAHSGQAHGSAAAFPGGPLGTFVTFC